MSDREGYLYSMAAVSIAISLTVATNNDSSEHRATIELHQQRRLALQAFNCGPPSAYMLGGPRSNVYDADGVSVRACDAVRSAGVHVTPSVRSVSAVPTPRRWRALQHTTAVLLKYSHKAISFKGIYTSIPYTYKIFQSLLYP